MIKKILAAVGMRISRAGALAVAFGSLLMACFMPKDSALGEHYVTAFRTTVTILGIITMLSSAVFYRLPRSAST